MNLYAWLSLCSSLTAAVLGIIVFSLNHKKLLNKLFLLAALAGFYWTFTEFMMWQASSVEVANFWNKMAFFRGSSSSFFLGLCQKQLAEKENYLSTSILACCILCFDGSND
jgi:hypothetical protein